MRLLAKGRLRLRLQRKRSRKGWLLRNALHQRRRPRKRKRPARLLKRNEYEREMCNVRVATVMDAHASSLRRGIRRFEPLGPPFYARLISDHIACRILDSSRPMRRSIPAETSNTANTSAIALVMANVTWSVKSTASVIHRPPKLR